MKRALLFLFVLGCSGANVDKVPLVDASISEDANGLDGNVTNDASDGSADTDANVDAADAGSDGCTPPVAAMACAQDDVGVCGTPDCWPNHCAWDTKNSIAGCVMGPCTRDMSGDKWCQGIAMMLGKSTGLGVLCLGSAWPMPVGYQCSPEYGNGSQQGYCCIK